MNTYRLEITYTCPGFTPQLMTATMQDKADADKMARYYRTVKNGTKYSVKKLY